MKQKKYQINDLEDIHNILRQGTIGRLATLDSSGYPYITPVNYVFHRGAIYFHCARAGEKTDNIQANVKVGFEVDNPLAYLNTAYLAEGPVCKVTQFYQSVIIRGRAEVVTGIQEKVDALNRLMGSHEQQKDFCEIAENTPAVAMCAVVRITIDFISGKQNLAQKKSQQEKQKIANYLRQRNHIGDNETADLILAHK